MRVEMTVDTDGVVTTVSREYEPNVERTFDGTNIFAVPALADVAQAVAAAAVTAHQITPKE
ncbi:hypothetical protein SEA_FRANSOYER_61 [Microbacterium phage Fransoyer]|nr:hypothetical protein SEA_FRANSOYER_61 [Microbacterium phage Fransoyer]